MKKPFLPPSPAAVVRRAMVWLAALAWLLPGGLAAQVSPPVLKQRTDHNKQIIGYLTQWGPWKDVAGVVPKGSLNQLNVDYSQYTILNFSFFGVAVDGSLHSGDYRNPNIAQAGVDQPPAPLVDTDIYSSWDLYLLQGELDIVQYVADGSPAYNLGYRNAPGGWRNANTGATGAFPLAIHQAGGRLGLLELAQQQGVKVLASIGGWSMGKHFGDVAADPVKQARFVAGCQQLIALGFDGVDLDWEFPGQAGMNFVGQARDYANFAGLVEAIRAAIGPTKLITAAFSAAPAKLTGFDWARLSKSMDYFNFMTYDYNGGWSNQAGHNAPLYDYPNAEYQGFSLDATTKAVKAAGLPLNKVTLGVAFYGRGVVTSGPAALNAPTVKRPETVSPDGNVQTCADFTNWPKDVWDGTPNYQAIVASPAGWTEQWDDNAKVPYRTKGNYFLSYDNERSIGLKAQYVKDQQLAGVIVWSASGDWLNLAQNPATLGGKLVSSPATTAPLVNKLNEVFASGPTPPTTRNQAPTVSLTGPAASASFAAPARLPLTASAADADGTISKVEFYQGTTLLGTATAAPYAYTWTDVAAGTYALTAKATDNQGTNTTSAAVSVTVQAGSGGGLCTVAAWNAATAYVAGNQASYSGSLYEAKWWTQNDNPATTSCQYCAWQLVGPCGGSAARGSTAAARQAAAGQPATLSLYPNPATNQLRLATTIPLAGSQYEVRNALGQVVQQGPAAGGVLNVAGLPAGLYSLRLTSAGQLSLLSRFNK